MAKVQTGSKGNALSRWIVRSSAGEKPSFGLSTQPTGVKCLAVNHLDHREVHPPCRHQLSPIWPVAEQYQGEVLYGAHRLGVTALNSRRARITIIRKHVAVALLLLLCAQNAMSLSFK